MRTPAQGKGAGAPSGRRSGPRPGLRLTGGIDFGRASPLRPRTRLDGGARIPHFDIKTIGAQHLPTKSGKVSSHCKPRSQSLVGHIDYVRDGAEISLSRHIDYLARDAAVEDLEAGLVIDALDEIALRDQKNALAIWTNIPGGRERQRDLFEAAERCERKPKLHDLTVSTEAMRHLTWLARTEGCPAKLHAMVRKLRLKFDAVMAKADRTGEPAQHVVVPVAKVTSAEAFDLLEFFSREEINPAHRVRFKQGRTGCVQTRMVGELPHGLTPTERAQVLDRFCQTLANYGYMVVGALHQPDPHNDNRNYHFHVDAYPRPSRWLDDHRCWDFEYTERKGGRDTFPLRQNKVRHVTHRTFRNADGKIETKEVCTNVAQLMRDHYLDAVGAVVGDRPGIVRYLRGTYADHGIERTPLEHMGNRATAAEKQGVHTPVGCRNARRQVQDDLAFAEKRAADVNKNLSAELRSVRSISSGIAGWTEKVRQYEALRREVIERDYHAAVCDAVEGMARSRAQAVLSGSTGSKGKAATPPIASSILDAATAHLNWVDRTAPSARERDAARRKTEQLKRRAERLWQEIELGWVARRMQPV